MTYKLNIRRQGMLLRTASASVMELLQVILVHTLTSDNIYKKNRHVTLKTLLKSKTKILA
jgi:uncharacterized membrane protein